MKKKFLRNLLKLRESNDKLDKTIEAANKILTEDVEDFLEKIEKKIKDESKPKRTRKPKGEK